jgi:hypothetical protein
VLELPSIENNAVMAVEQCIRATLHSIQQLALGKLYRVGAFGALFLIVFLFALRAAD